MRSARAATTRGSSTRARSRSSRRSRSAHPTSATSRCTARKARTARCSGCWTSWGSRTPAPRRSIARSRSTRSLRRTRWCAPASRTPDWVVVEGWALRDLGAGAALSQVTDRVGLPCVVKPSRSGSALGVELRRAGVGPGRGRHGGACRSPGPRSWKPRSRVRRSPSGSSARRRRRGAPAGRDRARRAGCSTTPPATRPEPPSTSRRPGCPRRSRPPARSRRCAATSGLHLRDVARVDTIVDASGTPWVLEVNVSPGMTETQPAADGRAGRGLVARRALRARAAFAASR